MFTNTVNFQVELMCVVLDHYSTLDTFDCVKKKKPNCVSKIKGRRHEKIDDKKSNWELNQ